MLAHGQASQMAVMAAATHPERVTSLVLVNGFARFARADDYPAGMPPNVQETYLDNVETQWGKGTLASFLGPSVWERPGCRRVVGTARALRRKPAPRTRTRGSE